MSTASELHTQQVVEAFDGVAETFETALENDITRALRKRLYGLLQSLIAPDASILDLNCGIGIDAVALAQRGYRVWGADISPAMVRQAQLRTEKLHLPIEYTCTSFEDLSAFSGKKFDLVFSNFGGLNCVPTLSQVQSQVSNVLKPGGYFVAVVMPPLSLWEIAAGVLRLNIASAFRRLRRQVKATGFGEHHFTVSYYSPRKFARAFESTCDVTYLEGLNVLSPPPHATTFTSRFASLSRRLERWERVLSTVPLFRSLGDHFVIVLQRKIEYD